MAPEVKTEADALFKDLGLTQKSAQRLVDFYTAKSQAAQNAPYEAYTAMTNEWRTNAENHPELKGKLGAGKEVNVRIGRMLDGLGDAALATEFKQAMDLTGAGNHPAFIRVLNKLAERVTEGSHVPGRGPSPGGQSSPNGQPRTAAQTLWPDLPSSQRR